MRAGANEPPLPTGEDRGARRDLQALRKLPRSAFVSYRKKHAQLHEPRSQEEARQRSAWVGYNGLAKMTLRDNQLTLDYVDVRGTRVFSETWAVDRGKLVRLKAR